MKVSIQKVLKIFLPLGIGIFLIWYSLSGFSLEEKTLLWNHITSANPFWLGISLFISILCHFSRAHRWNLLVEPLGYKPRIGVSFSSIMIGYVSNYGIPRSGDVLKAVTLSKYDNIPFQKLMGTVITERLIDFVMLLFFLAITFFCNTSLLVNYLNDQQIKPLNLVYMLLGALVLLFTGYQILRKLDFPFLNKIKKFVSELYDGVMSVFKMKQKFVFILHTFFIWFGYFFVVYLLKYSIPETSALTISGMLMAFVAGTFAFSTTNGGIGSYPITIGLVLLLFNIQKTDGEALGWIIWGSQTAFNILIGGLCFLYTSLFIEKK